MKNETPQTLPKASRAGFSLAEKGLVIFAFWALIQMTLVLSLSNLRTTGDIYALKTGTTREASLELRDIICLSGIILLNIDKSIESGALPEADCRLRLEELKAWGERLQKLLTSPDEKAFLANIVQKTCHLADILSRAKTPQEVREMSGQMQADTSEIEQSLLKLAYMRRNPLVLASAEEFHKESVWFKTAIALSIANLFSLIAVGFFFSRNIIERLLVLMENSARLSRGSKLLSPLRGSDEVANLDRAFHKMADSLVEAAMKERALFENASDVLCHIDSSFHLMNANKASTQVLGYSPAELLGMRLVEIVDPSQRDEAIDHLESNTRKGGQAPFELRVVKKDGDILDTLWSVKYVREEATYFCVVHDISERKAADQLRRQVVQMVNHDLRSPLSAIQVVYASLETGLMGQLNEKGLRNLNMAQASTTRKLRLINDLLDMEKLEAGMLTIQPENVALGDMLTEALDGVGMLAQAKGIQLEKCYAEMEIYADRHRIIQVLLNLLGNAIKFSPKGGIIMVSAKNYEDYVEISVIDQGRGVPQHLSRAIFDRFRQVQTSDATLKGGSGLGLAICKALVELHEGEIGVESKEGQGSRFYFRIPHHNGGA